jgi:crotonobetainyl-CoA:carnitine CoA-transferase CaiB-like acyl-CoA transferase
VKTGGSRPKPLHGVRVLDLTRLLPGPVATMHLADLGADVIKIEDTGAGDYARAMQSRYFFPLVNRNKRGLRLDLKAPAGREVFLRLARGADVIVEQFRPGVMERLGVGYDAVRAVNQRIVYCAITGYGQDGPYRDVAGHDINYIGYAGVGDQIGTPEAPVVPNFQIADLLGGSLTPVMGILAALVDARATGAGRYVDVAMADSVLAHAFFPLLGLLERGQPPERGTTILSGGLPCYNVYRTADGRFMAVGALERKFWENLCDTLGCPELKGRHYVYGEDARPVKARLQEIFARRTQAEWTAAFAHVDACVSPILRIDEALANEQFRARGMVLSDDGARGFAAPVKLSDFEFAVERGAPRPGEHSAEILREAGYADDEVAQLARNGVI